MDEMAFDSAEAIWAQITFGEADLGDKRRTKRLTAMAAAVAKSPAGNVTQVFRTGADRESAYRFVENEDVDPQAIVKAMRFAVVERCADEEFVFVAIDGSSVHLADHLRMKDYGSIGSRKKGGRGLKVTAGLAVSSAGVPIGLTSLNMWARGKKQKVHRSKRSLMEKESKYVAEANVTTVNAFAERKSSCRVWSQMDRENDAIQLLEVFSSTEQWYTVRASANRRINKDANQATYVYDAIARKGAHRGTYTLDIPAGYKRSARRASMSVRAAPVKLLLRDRRNRRGQELQLHAVHVRESSYVGDGEERIEWLLYTNHPIETDEDLALIIFGYCQRWRIEDFFRVWKTTGCNVEATQLHSTHSVRIWGTMLAAVAARIERMKHLARTEPYRPATIEFTEDEIDAIMLLKTKLKKKKEQIPTGIPTIEEVVRWIAELGGYTGKASGGPPGAVTIRRGMERLAMFVEALQILRNKAIPRCD